MDGTRKCLFAYGYDYVKILYQSDEKVLKFNIINIKSEAKQFRKKKKRFLLLEKYYCLS